MSGASGVRGIAGAARRVFSRDAARRRTKAALREAEERFRGAFETAAIGMALVSPDGRFLQVNASLCGLVGYERNELLRKTFQDITHRKLAEAALREAEQRFRRAFENSATGMALVAIAGDDSGRFLEVNQALCEIAGYEPVELCRMRFSYFIHPDDVERLGADVRALARGEIATHQAEVRFMGRGTSRGWAAFSASLVRDAAGEPVHAVVHVQDVTERKRFEGQLKHLADHDALTGLFNRRRFTAELEREVLAANRYGSGGAVLVLDIDHLKLVNDSLGHAEGDKLIVRIARALKERLGGPDIIGRLCGAEFGVILPWASP